MCSVDIWYLKKRLTICTLELWHVTSLCCPAIFSILYFALLIYKARLLTLQGKDLVLLYLILLQVLPLAASLNYDSLGAAAIKHTRTHPKQKSEELFRQGTNIHFWRWVETIFKSGGRHTVSNHAFSPAFCDFPRSGSAENTGYSRPAFTGGPEQWSKALSTLLKPGNSSMTRVTNLFLIFWTASASVQVSDKLTLSYIGFTSCANC